MKERHNHYFDENGKLIVSLPYGSKMSEHPKVPKGFLFENRAHLGAGYGAWYLVKAA